MRKSIQPRHVAIVLAATLGVAALPLTGDAAPAEASPEYLFHDAHFHLTNYIQQGTDIHKYLEIMGDKVGRSTLFGIPAAADLVIRELGRFRPDLLPAIRRAPVLLLVHRRVYRQRVPEARARAAQAHRPDDHGFQPGRHVCGGPHPARARDLPGRVYRNRRVHDPQGVCLLKGRGDTASLTDPALDRLLDFAGEVGLVVILHNDIDMPFAKTGAEPVFLTQMKDLLRRHPKTTIVWAHLGLGRVVHPVQDQASSGAAERSPRFREIVESILSDPTLSHVYFDISWDEVAKYASSPRRSGTPWRC